jgi:uncharacterized protein (DUF736 family)
VPFVSNELLQQLITETSALKERLAIYQGTVEQLTQITTSAAATHLNQTHDAIRRALAEQRDANAATVIAIRDDLRRLDRPAPAATPEAASASQAAPEGASEQDNRLHMGLLLTAAHIASAKLTCHRDAWAFLVEQTARDPHFRVRGEAHDIGAGRVQVDLSGPSIVAVLITLREAVLRHRVRAEAEPGNWAMAASLYNSISAVVGSVRLSRQADPDALQDVTITIDDGPLSVASWFSPRTAT